MKKQVIYNFAKLTGDYNSAAGQFEDRSRKSSRDRVSAGQTHQQQQQHQASHRMFRPTGIVKVRKDQVSSSSRSSINSVSRQSLKVSKRPYLDERKSQIENVEQFFERFHSDNVVKYKTVSGNKKDIRRNLCSELDGGGVNRPQPVATFELPSLKINEFKSSLVSSSRHSSSRESLLSGRRSQTKLTIKQIEAKYKKSQQKIQKIRQKVNQLYRLNTQSSEKQYTSLITRPKSKRGLEHRLLF